MRIHTRDHSATVSSHVSTATSEVTQVPVNVPKLVLEKAQEVKSSVLPAALKTDAPPILILYGSNTGTSEEAAYQLAYLAKKEGFKTTAVASLDSYIDRLGRGTNLISYCP
jgi:sulfite reductase alpha subunit-like flavoprotein